MSSPAEWGTRLEAAVCENCDWSYLLPPNSPPQRCPHCFEATLATIEEPAEQLPYAHSPELVLKPEITKERIESQIIQFAKGIPFHPRDLTPANLSGRLRHTFIPLWLVDGEVQASWQAEMGYDYQVVSHREKYDQNRQGWRTQEVKETRVRWEPRVGRLNRTYHNQPAPALEDELEMRRRLGGYRTAAAEPYQPQLISQAFVRLPNRPPEDAWVEAEPEFFKAGTAECQKAAEADHIRDFKWTAEFHNLNWTQLLRSAYSTYYLDDEGRPQPVYINGQTGHISGARRSSMRQARRWTLAILAVALALFLIGAGLAAAGFFLEFGLTAGGLVLAVSLGAALVSLTPIFISWNFNRKKR